MVHPEVVVQLVLLEEGLVAGRALEGTHAHVDPANVPVKMSLLHEREAARGARVSPNHLTMVEHVVLQLGRSPEGLGALGALMLQGVHGAVVVVVHVVAVLAKLMLLQVDTLAK